MESSELRRRRIKQNRRKERAEKVEKERATNDPDDDNVGPPVKKPRRKPRKPVAEEDIVDGFAILAFKNYDELTRAVKLAEEDSDHKKICVQLLKRSQEGGGDNNKTIEKDKKVKKPKTNCTLSTLPLKENGEIMVDKVPGIDIRSSVPSSVSPYPHPKKLGRMNGPSSKESSLHTLICESDDNGDKISDGCSDLFAPSRKDSSPTQPDNLHSSNETKGVDVQRHHNNCEKKPSSPSSTVVNLNSAAEVKLQPQPTKVEPLELESVKPLHKNGSVSSGVVTEELNGIRPHVDQSSGILNLPLIENKVAPSFQHQKPFKATVSQTLFTPYAATAITRVNTPVIPVSSQSSVQENLRDHSESPQPKTIQNPQSQRVSRNHNSLANAVITSSCSLSSGNFTSSSTGSHIRYNSSPLLDQTCQNKPTGSPSPLPGQAFNRKSFSPSSKAVIPPTTKSIAFGSIARLLDSPTTSTSSVSSNATVTASTNYSSVNHQSVTGNLANGSNSNHNGIGTSTPITCSSRSHSPRGHSPSRERDSYSSNVSSLSRTSVTPVSGSNQVPPTLSPLQNLQSYSKAASWLNSTVPGLSPVPRPTPPPVSNSSSGSAASNSLISGGGVAGPSLQISGGASLAISGGGSLSITAGNTPNPHSVFPGLVPGAPHTLPPSHSAAAMFAPPILPLTSIAPHPSAHPSPFGPATDALFHGSATSSELVRRDLESRFLSSERSLGGGPSTFLTRPGDLHPHSHPLLPPLSGVNHLPPQSPGNSNQPPQHSALFASPLFKDMQKVGLDSSFYRTNLALQYPGFNGMLPPNIAATPFAPPSQIAAFTPKITDACKPAKVMKAGRWNAMHVRIAWEIYQDQQKGGGESKGGNSSSSPAKSSLLVSSANSNPIPPPPPTSSGLAADLLRQPPQHVFAGLGRPPDVGPGPPYSASLLSQHHGTPPTHRPQFDSSHSLFLNSAAHLGPPLPRYPGFSGLGPTYGGIGGLGSSLLSRDLSSLAALGTSQEHWHRSHRGPPFPPVGQLGSGWPMQRSDRDVKTPIESRRHKEERFDKRQEYHSESGKGSRDMSPFRDRSPLRPSRTPLENGDTDSRSSRSSDSHSTVHISSNKSFSRNKEESNGDLDRTGTPLMALEREKLLHQLPSDTKHQALISVSHPSRDDFMTFRLYHPGSPLSTPTSMGGWDSFPGLMGSGPRMPGADSFRLSFLPLSERERELSRIQNSAMRPPMFSNGPFANIPPLGMGQHSLHSSPGGSAINKGSPGGGPIPSLNPSISAAVHNHLLHSSSLNGPNSPKLDDFNPASIRTKEDSQSR